MFFLVLAHLVCPGQNPESAETVECMYSYFLYPIISQIFIGGFLIDTCSMKKQTVLIGTIVKFSFFVPSPQKWKVSAKSKTCPLN